MVKGWTRLHNDERQVIDLLDSRAKINLINQTYVVQWDLKSTRVALPTPGFLDGTSRYCYGAYELNYHLIDSWGQHRECTTLFYVVEYAGPDVVLGMPMIAAEGILIDPEEGSWRFKVAGDKLEIVSPKEFAEDLANYSTVYAIVCAGVTTASDKKTVPTEVPDELKDLQDVCDDVQAGILPELGRGDHAIELQEGKEPPYMSLYNLSQTELAELRRYLEDALAKGWIKHSVLPAGASILFVPKRDDGLRLCVDYRGLNAITIKNRHPLPLITETLDRLCGAKRFIKLDLKDAYHRIRIKRGDEWKTAFRTRYGHFEYQVMPFGLANAPATFQAYINKALRGLVDVTCVVYLDDILIYSNDPAEHWRHVRQVLERLQEYSLYVNLKKCQFNTIEIEFLSFIVIIDGVRMDPKRIKMIKEWPKSKTHRELQVFLGFVNFYRRFIHRYSKIARPLIDLLKGSKNGKKFGSFV